MARLGFLLAFSARLAIGQQTWSPLSAPGQSSFSAGSSSSTTGSVAVVEKDPFRQGCVYVGGSFYSFSGRAASNLVHYCVDTGAVTPLDLDGPVYAIAVNGSSVFLGGLFGAAQTAAGKVTLNRVAEYQVPLPPADVGSGSWQPLLGPPPTTGPRINGIGSGWVNALSISGSNVIIGGSFSDCGSSLTISNLCFFDGLTRTLTIPYTPLLGQGANGIVNALVTDNSVSPPITFLCGDFTVIGKSSSTFVSASGIGQLVGTNLYKNIASGSSNGLSAGGCSSIAMRGGAAGGGTTELFVAGTFTGTAGSLSLRFYLAKVALTGTSNVGVYSALTGSTPPFNILNNNGYPTFIAVSKSNPDVLWIAGPLNTSQLVTSNKQEVNGMAAFVISRNALVPFLPTTAGSRVGVQSVCGGRTLTLCPARVNVIAEIETSSSTSSTQPSLLVGGSFDAVGGSLGGGSNGPYPVVNNVALYQPDLTYGPSGVGLSPAAVRGQWTGIGSPGNGLDAQVVKLLPEADIIGGGSNTKSIIVAGRHVFAGSSLSPVIARYTPGVGFSPVVVSPDPYGDVTPTAVVPDGAGGFFFADYQETSTPTMSMPLRRCSPDVSIASTYTCTSVGPAGVLFAPATSSTGSAHPIVRVIHPFPDNSGRFLVGGQWGGVTGLANASTVVVLDGSGMGSWSNANAADTKRFFKSFLSSLAVPSVTAAVVVNTDRGSGTVRPWFLVGGSFGTEEGSGREFYNIAWYDPQAMEFYPVIPVNRTIPGLDGGVEAMVTYPAADSVFVAGSFSYASVIPLQRNGILLNGLGRYNYVLNTWQALGSGIKAQVLTRVRALALDPAVGDLYVTGQSLTNCGPSSTWPSCSGIAKWSTTNSAFTPLTDMSASTSTAEGFRGTGNALSLIGKDLYVGGAFSAVAGGTKFALNVAVFDITAPSPSTTPVSATASNSVLPSVSSSITALPTSSSSSAPTASSSMSVPPSMSGTPPPSQSRTAASTPLPSVSGTPPPSQSRTAASTPLPSLSGTPAPSLSSSTSNTPSNTGTGSSTETGTQTGTSSQTGTHSQTAEATPSESGPSTPSHTAGASASASAVPTSSPSIPASLSTTETPSQTTTGSGTETASQSAAATRSSSATAEPSLSTTSQATLSPSETATGSVLPSLSSSATSSSSAAPSATSSSSDTPAASSTAAQSATTTPTATISSAGLSSSTPSPTPTASASPSAAAVAVLVSVEIRLNGASLTSLLQAPSSTPGAPLLLLRPLLLSLKSYLATFLTPYYRSSTTAAIGIMLASATDVLEQQLTIDLLPSDAINDKLMPPEYYSTTSTSSSTSGDRGRVLSLVEEGGRGLQSSSSVDGVSLSLILALPTSGLQLAPPLDNAALLLIKSAMAQPGPVSQILDAAASGVASVLGVAPSAMTASVIAVDPPPAPQPPQPQPSVAPSRGPSGGTGGNNGSSSSNSITGPIVGGVLGAIVLVTFAALGVWFFVVRPRSSSQARRPTTSSIIKNNNKKTTGFRASSVAHALSFSLSHPHQVASPTSSSSSASLGALRRIKEARDNRHHNEDDDEDEEGGDEEHDGDNDEYDVEMTATTKRVANPLAIVASPTAVAAAKRPSAASSLNAAIVSANPLAVSRGLVLSSATAVGAPVARGARVSTIMMGGAAQSQQPQPQQPLSSPNVRSSLISPPSRASASWEEQGSAQDVDDGEHPAAAAAIKVIATTTRRSTYAPTMGHDLRDDGGYY